jgi:hypothetical protein
MTCGVERGEESRGILIRIRSAGKPYASKFAGAGNKGRAPNEAEEKAKRERSMA